MDGCDEFKAGCHLRSRISVPEGSGYAVERPFDQAPVQPIQTVADVGVRDHRPSLVQGAVDQAHKGRLLEVEVVRDVAVGIGVRGGLLPHREDADYRGVWQQMLLEASQLPGVVRRVQVLGHGD